MDFWFCILFLIFLVVIFSFSISFISALEEISKSKYRNCEVFLSEDQFIDLLRTLEEISENIKEKK